jgi:hypothetical protein
VLVGSLGHAEFARLAFTAAAAAESVLIEIIFIVGPLIDALLVAFATSHVSHQDRTARALDRGVYPDDERITRGVGIGLARRRRDAGQLTAAATLGAGPIAALAAAAGARFLLGR